MKTLLVAFALSIPATSLAQTAPAAKPATAPAAKPATTPAAAAPLDPVKLLGKAVMDERAALVAKNLPLSAEQAAKFWPLYEKYQAGFSELLIEQLEIVNKYTGSYDKLDDAGAIALINGQLDRDAKVAAYRIKWLPEFQKVLPGKLAARFIQIDRRLSNITQMEINAQIPLVQ